MFTGSPESQLHPGLHENKHDKQAKGGDSAFQLCSRESSGLGSLT